MSSTGDRLSGALFELAEGIDHHLEEEGLEPSGVIRSHRSVDLDYSPGSVSMQSSIDHVEEQVWLTDTKNEIENYCESLDSFEQAAKEISNRVNTEHHKPEFLLERFISEILEASLDELDYPTIVNIISTFENQLDGSPISWHPKIYLSNIQMAVEETELSKGIILRQPVSDDFEGPANFFHPRSFDLPGSIPGAIIEFSLRASDSDEVTQKIDLYKISLQLYDVGSATVLNAEYNPNAVLPTSSPGQNPVNQRRWFKYTLEEGDTSDLQEFFSTLQEPIYNELVDNQVDSPVTIGYDRYQNALDESKSRERQLTSGIMALEALLLKETEHGELSERLSRRGGVLLYHFGFQPNEVCGKIKRAYNIRSKYVHGSKLDGDTDLVDLTKDIMDYVRRCLVIFLQIETEEGKEKLLNKVDNASLHPEARESLDDMLSEEISV